MKIEGGADKVAQLKTEMKASEGAHRGGERIFGDDSATAPAMAVKASSYGSRSTCSGDSACKRGTTVSGQTIRYDVLICRREVARAQI